jgi:hypothetical protein
VLERLELQLGSETKLFSLIDPIGLAPFWDQLVELVHVNLAINWPWVALELLYRYLRRFIGESDRWQFRYRPKAVPAATVEKMVTIKQGETIREFQRRMAAEFNRAQQSFRVRQNVLPSGRKGSPPVIKMHVYWFYSSKIMKRSIRELAREYHEEQRHTRTIDDCDDRKTVRYGIAQAERVLALAPLRFRPLGKESREHLQFLFPTE